MVRRTAPCPLLFGPLVLGLLLGCGEGETSTQAAGPSSATPSGTAPLASATATATASAPSPDHPWAGLWSGRFEAKKGEVGVPEGVAYPVWEEEKGDEASGAGAVELTIAPDGEVTGTGRGALGAFVLRGRVENETLRSGLTPADDEGAMHGVLTAKEKEAGKSLEAVLRVSGGRGARVRTATFVLGRGALGKGALGDDENAETPTPAPTATTSAAPPP